VSTITLDDVIAEQQRLAALIEALKANACQTKILIVAEAAIELRPGELYAGLLLGDDGNPSHHLVLLPDRAEEVTWDAAVEFARKAGGELPTRREQSLLFANLKDQFEAAWYWSGEQYEGNGSYAWYQYFRYGNQNGIHKSYEGRAVAVRRLPA
jgi:hypothetical protein